MRSQASRHKYFVPAGDTAELGHGFVHHFIFEARGA